MAVDAHADFLQLAFEDIGGLLAGVLGDDNTSDIESLVGKGLDQAKDIHVVGNAQVMADLILFDVRGIDGDDDLSLRRKSLNSGNSSDITSRSIVTTRIGMGKE